MSTTYVIPNNLDFFEVKLITTFPSFHSSHSEYSSSVTDFEFERCSLNVSYLFNRITCVRNTVQKISCRSFDKNTRL